VVISVIFVWLIKKILVAERISRRLVMDGSNITDFGFLQRKFVVMVVCFLIVRIPNLWTQSVRFVDA